MSSADEFISGPTTRVEPHSDLIRDAIRESRALIEALQWQFARRGIESVTIRFSNLLNLHDVHLNEAQRAGRLK